MTNIIILYKWSLEINTRCKNNNNLHFMGKKITFFFVPASNILKVLKKKCKFHLNRCISIIVENILKNPPSRVLLLYKSYKSTTSIKNCYKQVITFTLFFRSILYAYIHTSRINRLRPRTVFYSIIRAGVKV